MDEATILRTGPRRRRAQLLGHLLRLRSRRWASAASWSLRLVNFVAPLEAAGTPVTVAKDVPAAAKA